MKLFQSGWPRVLLLLLGLLPTMLWAQRTLTGTVTDTDGTPLVGVNILVGGTSSGTITDFDGNYELTVNDGAQLIFSYTGYSTEERTVAAGISTLDVVMSEGTNLDEVVVTALGISRQKKALGYAVQEVSSTELLESRQPNLVNAMQGRVAGVQISSAGGGPGEASRIVIRGVNSLDPSANNQPLFVVDGVLIDNTTSEVGGGGLRNVSNRVADLNPEDIESMSVLKGGAATALYGVRAANGAVIITTKRGRPGQLSVSVTSSLGTEEVNKFPETQRVYTQGFGGNYDENSFWPSWGPTVDEARQLDPNHPATIFNNFENAYQQGNQWRNTVSISGGSDKATFRSSVSRFDHEGVLPFSNFASTSFLFNGDIKASETFSFGGSINYINSGGDRVVAESFNERLVYWAPQADVTNYQTEDGTMIGYRFDGTVGNNPIYGAATNQFTDDVDRFIYNLNFSYRPTSWFALNYRAGMDQYSDDRFERGPGQRFPGQPFFENNGARGFTNETTIRRRDVTSTLNAQFSFSLTDKLSTTLLLGNDIFSRSADRLTVNGNELDIYDFFTTNNASIITTESDVSQYRLYGFYGDLSFNFNDLLYLGITGRNDWSSTLPVDSRSFFYPSVSLGLIVSELIQMPDWITYAKLRSSVAGIGKDTNPYRTRTVYDSRTDFTIDNATAWTRGNSRGAAELEPERTNTFEIGTDLRFFNNRLGVDLTYYNQLSSNQIIPVPSSPSSGFDNFILNAGSIRNKGIELVLDVEPIRTQNLSWGLTFNYTSNQNEVEEIVDGVEQIVLGSHFGYVGSSASLILIEGEAYGNLYGRSWARYYENPNDDDGVTLARDRPLLIGANGFPIVDTRQRLLGNSTPEWFGAIRSDLTWKSFNFSLLVDTRQGVDKYNQLDNFFSAFGTAPYTLNRNETIVFEGVTSDGSPNTKPVFLGQGTGPDGVNYGNGYYRNYYRGVTENFIQDASWWRLRTVSLGYSLPSRLLENTLFKGANVTLTGNNLWLDTEFSGFDPEGNRGAGNADDGFGGFTYPSTRSYFVTVNLTF